MLYFFLWLFFGSIGTNISWIILEKEDNPEFKLKHYIKGFLLGLALGPLTIPIHYLMKNKRIKNKLKVTSDNFEELLLKSAEEALQHANGEIKLKEEFVPLNNKLFSQYNKDSDLLLIRFELNIPSFTQKYDDKIDLILAKEDNRIIGYNIYFARKH
jgi:hypothetical protein